MIFLAAVTSDSYSSSADEIELIERIQRKDTDALGKLYDLYNRMLYGLILSIVKNRKQAEELLQEVFKRVWREATDFKTEKGNVYIWLVTLTRRIAIDYIRSDRDLKGENIDTIQADSYDPFKSTIYSDRTELVKKALTKIPEEQLEVLKIAYYRGMTQQEIADSLNITLKTVKTRTTEGMLKFKQVLESYITGHG